MQHDSPARARDVAALGPVVGCHVSVLPADGRNPTGLLELKFAGTCQIHGRIDIRYMVIGYMVKSAI